MVGPSCFPPVELVQTCSWFMPRNSDCDSICLTTLPETNIAPARKPSKKETCFPTIHFCAMLVFQPSSRSIRLKLQRMLHPCGMSCNEKDTLHQKKLGGRLKVEILPFRMMLWWLKQNLIEKLGGWVSYRVFGFCFWTQQMGDTWSNVDGHVFLHGLANKKRQLEKMCEVLLETFWFGQVFSDTKMV